MAFWPGGAVPSHSMASDMLCCQGGAPSVTTANMMGGRTGPVLVSLPRRHARVGLLERR